MKNMSLKEIAAACRGVYYGKEEFYCKEVTGVAIDSRKIKPGFLFVAVRGSRVDGHMFIPQVISDGALCVISERRLENVSFPYILVHSSLQALKDIAEHYRKSLDIRVIGISGSVGKTSTKEMIASVLEQKYCVLKTEGNFNNEIGLPLTIFNIRKEHEIAVLEMGISRFGEMERLAKIARPDICVITNIGYAHLEQLKSREGILKAKTEMFQYMNPNGTILLNGDDDMLATVTRYQNIIPVFFGLSDSCEVYASNVKNLGLKGTSCRLHLRGIRTEENNTDSHTNTDTRTLDVTIPVPGTHMVYNALAGAAAGFALGLSDPEIKAGIESLVPIAGRNHLIEKNGLTIIDDCYNANPASMRASLDVLSCADTRKVAVLGDMGELGDAKKQMHYEIGAYAAELQIDLLCCIGQLSADMYQGASDSEDWKGTVLHFPTKEDFFSKMHDLIRKGDTILVKASHYMDFPEVVENLQKMLS